MLVSHERRFIFVHVPKCAGRSIRGALSPCVHCTQDYWSNRLAARLGARSNLLAPTPWRWLRQHTTARRARLYLPRRIFDSYFKFAFVRNPWDWLVSDYHFVKARPAHRRYRHVERLGSFENYVRAACQRPRSHPKDFVTDRRGQLLVDFVGRFESLREDFATICRRLQLKAELERRNPSNHRDYREYYSRDLKDLVAKAYREDIEFFGYEFDGPCRGVTGCSSLAPLLESR